MEIERSFNGKSNRERDLHCETSLYSPYRLRLALKILALSHYILVDLSLKVDNNEN